MSAQPFARWQCVMCRRWIVEDEVSARVRYSGEVYVTCVPCEERIDPPEADADEGGAWERWEDVG